MFALVGVIRSRVPPDEPAPAWFRWLNPFGTFCAATRFDVIFLFGLALACAAVGLAHLSFQFPARADSFPRLAARC